MPLFGWLILALWLALVVYWGFAAAAIKRQLGSRWIWWREIAVRLALFSLVIVMLRITVGGASQEGRLYGLNIGMTAGCVGSALCALGIGWAIRARSSLGRNWPMPNSSHQKAELITTGPYAYVRHPIYGGMLLAMLGSAIAQSVLWLVPLAVYGPQFIRSARREERFLIDHFPERYRTYMTRTKMLWPFLL